MNKGTILFSIPLSLSLIGLGGCGSVLIGDPSSVNGGGEIPMAPPLIDGYGNPAPELNVLDNPDEQQEEWTEGILADSQAEADRRCQQMAESYKVNFVKAQRRTAKGKTYDCVFRTRN